MRGLGGRSFLGGSFQPVILEFRHALPEFISYNNILVYSQITHSIIVLFLSPYNENTIISLGLRYNGSQWRIQDFHKGGANCKFKII